MHGIIHAELKKYVLARLGAAAWNELLREAQLAGRIYHPGKTYPDQEAAGLIAATARMTAMEVDALLQDFGEFIAPDLLLLYRNHLNPRWRTLDCLEHTEATIHRIVRVNDAGASPPKLRAHRLGPDHLRIEYDSHRRLCGVAKGIVRGTAQHYGEEVEVEEPRCMHRGDSCCQIDVRVIHPAGFGEPR